jgi:hypothetical protein
MDYQKIAKNLLLNHACFDCLNLEKIVSDDKKSNITQITMNCKYKSKIPKEGICDQWESLIQYGHYIPYTVT